jgi:hypothetical protein
MVPKKRDLLFARIGCILLVVGSLVIGLAPTTSVMLIGKNKKTRNPLHLKTGQSLSF